MTWDTRALIRDKREGRSHDLGGITALVEAYAAGRVPDYQVSAWLMAAFLNGLDEGETQELTLALLNSGRTFDWSHLGRPTVDKHSTGGIGDKISLPLAPLVAACGALVPMVSGRGLGHTGGTLDKLESIPGFSTQLSHEAMNALLDQNGLFMVGQGPELAPADGLLYALRDATSTVESQSFITSSIVSKKIAEGARSLVFDVKCGRGAFMSTLKEATALGERLVRTASGLGARSRAYVTDMEFPIGSAVGNALEVMESIAVLQGAGPMSTRLLTVELAVAMLQVSGVEPDEITARRRVERSLASGEALERFLKMVEAQGGDVRTLDSSQPLHPAPVIMRIRAPQAGWLSGCNGRELGEVVVAMGGGRRTKEDAIDPRVGMILLRDRGSRMEEGEEFAELHMAQEDDGLARRAADCFEWTEEPPEPRASVLQVIH